MQMMARGHLASYLKAQGLIELVISISFVILALGNDSINSDHSVAQLLFMYLISSVIYYCNLYYYYLFSFTTVTVCLTARNN